MSTQSTSDPAALVENGLLEVSALLRQEILLEPATQDRAHLQLLALYERAQDA
jgi:hypothetical protein